MTTTYVTLPSQPPIYPNTASLPSNSNTGTVAVVLTTPPSLYLFDGTTWNLAGGGPVTTVNSVTGTANQIIVNPATGDVVISTPQDINITSNVQFGKLGLGSAVETSSVLSLSSTSLGFLPPRMTTTQKNAISTPATGLVVYDTTIGEIQFYNGSAWIGTNTSGVISLTGTSNQIAVSSTTGAVTASLTNGISIGSYQATTPPTGGLIAPGNILSGLTSALTGSSSTRNYISVQGSTDRGVVQLLTSAADGNGVGVGNIEFGMTTNSGGATPNYRISGITGVSEGSTANQRGGALVFLTTISPSGTNGYTEKMRLNNLGYLGINDTNPGSYLSVVGNAQIGFASGTAAPSNGLIVNGNVYIGSSSQSTKLGILEVTDSTANYSLVCLATNASGSAGGGIWIGANKGSATSSGDRLGAIYFGGYNGSALTGQPVAINVFAAENFTVSATGSYLSFATTPVTTITRTERMRIGSQGGITLSSGNNPTNLLDAPSGGTLTGAQIGFAAGTTSPSNGLVVSGKFGVGTSTLNSNNYIEFAGTLSSSGGTQYLKFDPILTCTATSSTFIGQYFNTTFSIAASQTLTNAAQIYIDPGVGTLASGASITNGYGLYVLNPGFGTTKTAIYSDNMSIGYASTTPPSSGMIVSGQVSIGSSTPVITNSKLEVASGWLYQTYNTAAFPTLTNVGGFTVGWNHSQAKGEVNFFDAYSGYNANSKAFDFWSVNSSSNGYNRQIAIYNNGGLSVGQSYSDSAPPANGAIFEGNVYIGNNSGLSQNGNVVISAGTATASSNTLTLVTNTGNISLQFSNYGTATTANQGYALQSINQGTSFQPLYLQPSGPGISVGYSVAAPTGGAIFAGNVGIGTTSLNNTLDVHVNSQGAISASNGICISNQYNNANAMSSLTFLNDANTEMAGIYGIKVSGTNGALAFATNPGSSSTSERMRINNIGNVGINDTAPGSKLSVVGNAQIGFASATTAPTNGLVISGQFGVGTSSVNSSALSQITSSSSFPYSFYITGTNTSLDAGNNQIAINLYNTMNPTNDAGSIIGIISQPSYIAASTKTISVATAIHGNPILNANVGTITNFYNIYAQAGTSNTGTVTNSYSIYAELPSYGTNKYCAYFGGIVGVGTTAPTASSIFHVASTTKGSIAFPPMTTTQRNAISSPAEALMVYDATLHLPYFYNGTAWTAFGSGSGSGNTFQTVSSSTTVTGTSTTGINFVGCTAGSLTVSLPASIPAAGWCCYIKDQGQVASSSNITISGNGYNIDGSSTFLLYTSGAGVMIYSNGSQYYVA